MRASALWSVTRSTLRLAHIRAALSVALLAGCEGSTDNDNPNASVTQITLSQSSVSVAVGASVQVTATPKNAAGAVVTGATVAWTTESAAIATVTNGLILGVSAGSTVVHATSGSISEDITVAVTPAIAVTGSEFPIANTAGQEDFGGMAYDGTNYLVAVQGETGTGQGTVEAQRVSGTGALLGSRIVVPGKTGDPARIAFDGTNYLMAWADHTGPSSTIPILGQLVSTSGALVGSTFTIAPGNSLFGGVAGLAFGNGMYLIAYARETGTTGNATFTTYGRLISPSGTAGAELTFSGTTTEGFHAVAFDGTRFLTVYTDGLSAKGRFVTTAGVMSSEVTVYTVPAGEGMEPTVTVGFNGTNYLVTLGRHGPGHGTGADAYARVVTPAGTTVGDVVTIAADPALDEMPVGVVGTGTSFLVSYLDFATTGTLRVRGRFVTGAGAALGSAFTLASPQSGKTPIGGVFHYNGSKYFLLLTRGIPNSTEPFDFSLWTQNDIHGALLTIAMPGG